MSKELVIGKIVQLNNEGYTKEDMIKMLNDVEFVASCEKPDPICEAKHAKLERQMQVVLKELMKLFDMIKRGD